MYIRLRKKLQVNKQLVCGMLCHAVFCWIILAVSYNTYKGFIRDYEPLTVAVKVAIKSTFPITTIVFTGLYALFLTKGRFKAMILPVSQYAYIYVIYGLLINILIFSKGINVLVSFNLSLVYSFILLIIYPLIHRIIIVLRDWLQPIIYANLQKIDNGYFDNNKIKIQDWLLPIVFKNVKRIKNNPASFFIVLYMLLISFCALVLSFKSDSLAKQVANVAYFSLVIGIAIEAYNAFKNGSHDN